ncbi:MAG TPA: DUF3253 domain-containing protein [Anaerolineae bacterium]|nr:DUF3253 domain-containing protein [Anaerolineae bacterium]
MNKQQKSGKQPRKPRKVSDEEVRYTLLTMCAEAGLEGKVRPEDVAMAILTDQWQTLLSRLRLMCKQQAIAGYIEILRKGEVADPEDFKGVIRLRITEAGLREAAVVEMPKKKKKREGWA